MSKKMRFTIDDLEVVSGRSVAPHKTPPCVIVGFRHFAGRLARLGVPHPETRLATFLLKPHDALEFAHELLRAAEEALSAH